MRKHIALFLACIFYLSVLPVYSAPNWATYPYLNQGVKNLVVKESPWVDVRAYGAVGDNTTDDTAAIQAAIDNATTGTYYKPIYFPEGSYKVTSTLTVTNKVGVEFRGAGYKASIIKGVDISGPVLNIGGSRITMSDMQIYADNCTSAVWAYRTATQSGGDLRFQRVTFDGTPTACMLYFLGQEVNQFINCYIITRSDVLGYVSAQTDALSLSPPGLAAGDQSNTVTLFRGGNIWAYSKTPSGGSTTDASKAVKIYNGGNYTFDGVYFYAASPAESINLGNTTGNSTYSITVRNCRFEGDGYPVHMISQVDTLEFIGNSAYTATNPIYADNNAILVGSFIFGNEDYVTAGSNTYHLWTAIRSFIFSPMANVEMDYAQLSQVHAYAVTYNNASYPQSRTANVYEYATHLKKEYDQYKELSVVPYFGVNGVLAYPDGTNWNPSGLGKKPAFYTDGGNATGAWYQFPMVSDDYPPNTVPAANDSFGTAGTLAWNATHLYTAIADNTWKRVAWDNAW